MARKNGYSIQFDVPGKPRTKENKGQFKNKSFYFRKYPEIVEWEQQVHDIAIEAMKDSGWPGPYKGRCIIGAEFCFDSWTRRDITNFWKSLNDALNGAVWVDDSQVDASIQVRHIDRKNPHVNVFVWFIDMDFEESFGKKKPDTYNCMNISGLSLFCAESFIKTPEEAKSKRFGKFVAELGALGTRAKNNGTAPKKATPRKVDKRGRQTSEQAKAKAKAELSRDGCKNSTPRKRSTKGRPRSSSRAAG